MNAAEYEAMYRVEDTLWWYTGMRRIAESLLGERLRRARRILDAGCGTGGNLRWLAQYGEVHGVDLSREAMRFCQLRGLTTVARASILRLPYPSETFDLVTSFDVIYHLDVSDDVAALGELRRVLRPGGTLLVRVPAYEGLRSEHDAAVHTRQRYSLDELRVKATRAGLAVRRASYANTLLFPAAAAARLAARVWGGERAAAEHQSDVRPVAPAVNRLFRAALDAEAAVLARRDLPAGLSALIVAERS
ncbi:MAG TPA: class I SAM-dependent methyltransferase [Chloroflexota bacterium]|nr:class I SAM-dependent methyltransferase [Chloroflexota bacterium]